MIDDTAPALPMESCSRRNFRHDHVLCVKEERQKAATPREHRDAMRIEYYRPMTEEEEAYLRELAYMLPMTDAHTASSGDRFVKMLSVVATIDKLRAKVDSERFGLQCPSCSLRGQSVVEFQAKKLELVRERIAAIQRETKRPGDLALNMGTIEAMCAAILNPDFAEEIGVEATL
jgi:hypothetical protein